MIDRIRALLLRRGAVEDPDVARIRLEGYPGRGTVVAVRLTGRRHGERRQVDLTLDVYLGRSRTFRVEIQPWVLDAELARLQPGRAVPVAADHDEPGHVVLAFDMDEVRPIEGLGPVAGGPGGPRKSPTRPGPDDDR
jgi:hypothetical protein